MKKPNMDNKKLYTLVIAYLLVIVIWSTTPLAIKWSGESVGFIFGVAARMLIGAVLAMALTLVYFKKLPLHGAAIKVYLAAGLGIFGAMTSTYWGAQFIPSGLISIVFGLTPIITAWMASRLLQENSMTLPKISGSLLGLSGLLVIFFEQIQLGSQALMGLSAVLLAVALHSISSVWVKYIDARLPALVVTAGGLLFSLPLFLFLYMVFAEPLPAVIPDRPIWSVIYLGVMGSVVGFVSFYYVLANLQASTVALITLLTPVTALWLGSMFNDESLTGMIVIGTLLVLLGLVIHQWSGKLLRT
ncbi:MAG: DMT family transporter [Gammaproteobacteria bacterium]|nr:DMT family transporter [Gammaproteobacteria bacterium]